MKKLVFLIAICLVPNLVMAVGNEEAGEWPTFSNDPSASHSIKVDLMNIGGQTIFADGKDVPINNYVYRVDEHNGASADWPSCSLNVYLIENAKIEFKPDFGSSGKFVNTYRLFVNNLLLNHCIKINDSKICPATMTLKREKVVSDDDKASVIEEDEVIDLSVGSSKNNKVNFTNSMSECSLM